MFINFSDIPGNNNLFLDYLYEFDNVKQFYKINFREKESYSQHFKHLSSKENEKRDTLAEIISSQYFNQNPSAKTLKNISQLKDKHTLAIITGQQLGLLGGPLYTLYKTITTIKLAQYLSERYDEYNFIPVFWLEGDDHDFEEVRWINFINEENSLITIKYSDDLPEEDNRGSIGNKVFDDKIKTFINEIEKNLKHSDFKPSIIDDLKKIYFEGNTFINSFRELMFNLFDDYGLVIFDPQDINVKKLLLPVFKKEFEDFRIHTEALINTSAKLEENYHAQVKVRPINLFKKYENGRYSIEPSEDNFRLRHKRVKYNKDEILAQMEISPEIFSPNVLLRPICQDYLFPTAFYVGGPAEICYSAQVLPLYSFFEIIPPIIYPRSSATIIEKNISAIIEKYHLSIKDLFFNREKITEKIINDLSEINVDDRFNTTKDKIIQVLEDLKNSLFEIDKTTADSSDKYKQKFLTYLDELKIKAIEAQKRKYEIAIRQIQRTLVSVFPNNGLQERDLNYFYFANKYGTNLINHIFEELSINKFEHQIIHL
jgi:bacillithiol biosynthesis cysteine-adding enzyme BshC